MAASGRSLCQSPVISLTLWVDYYESATLQDLRNFLQENYWHDLLSDCDIMLQDQVVFPAFLLCKESNRCLDALR